MGKIFGIGFLVALLVGGGFFGFYRHMVREAEKDRAALQERAFNEGIRKGQVDMAKATNDALIEEIKRIADLQEATNRRISDIRRDARTQQRQIDQFDTMVGETRPKVVEDWANKTTTDLFKGIEEATQ